ncbi:hypothetical protein ACLOJK_007692 [Asimina triloba]
MSQNPSPFATSSSSTLLAEKPITDIVVAVIANMPTATGISNPFFFDTDLHGRRTRAISNKKHIDCETSSTLPSMATNYRYPLGPSDLGHLITAPKEPRHQIYLIRTLDLAAVQI